LFQRPPLLNSSYLKRLIKTAPGYQSFRATPLPSLNPPASTLIQSTVAQMAFVKAHSALTATTTIENTLPHCCALELSRSDTQANEQQIMAAAR